MSKLSKELKSKAGKILQDIQKLNQAVEENDLIDEEWYIKYVYDLKRYVI